MLCLENLLPKIFSGLSQTTRAYLALGFGLLSLGFSAIFVRGANAPGTITAFYRMAIGSLVMVIPFANQFRNDASIRPARHSIWLAILGGVFFGSDLVLWTSGIVMSGATIPTLMANIAPLWVGLGAFLFFRERQGVRFWMGLLVAIIGAAIILGQDFSKASNIGMGSLLGLGSGVFYGAYYLTTQRARTGMRTLSYFWISTASSMILLLFVNLILERTLTGYDSLTYTMFLGIGLLVQVGGWLAINYAQGFLPASIISSTLLGQPVLTAVIAWPLFGENLNAWQIFGGAAVITGVYLVHRSRSNGRRVSASADTKKNYGN